MKYNYGMLVVAALSAATSLAALTNKTFITPQGPLTSAYHHNERHDGDSHHSLSYHFNHFESTNHKALGKYFGFGNKSEITVADAGAVPSPDFAAQSLVHDSTLSTLPLAGTMSLAPRREVNELTLRYHYKTELFNRRFSLGVHLPLARVMHDLRPRVTGETTMAVGADTFGVLDYFAGNIVQTIPASLQKSLTSARWGKQVYSGVKGICLNAGLNLIDTEMITLDGELVGMIPLERKPTGRYLFEPVLHNGGHFEIGTGLHAVWHAYENDWLKFTLQSGAQARYLIENRQQRTVGINFGNASNDWAVYRLLGQVGQRGVFPAANVLTQKVSVQPGFRVNGSLMARCQIENWFLSAGYGINWKESERVKIKSWDDTQYALASASYDTTEVFGFGNGANPGPNNVSSRSDSDLITRAMLNPAAAASAAQLTHHIVASAGIEHQMESVLMRANVGGGYEFQSGSARGFEGWSVHGGLAFNF